MHRKYPQILPLNQIDSGNIYRIEIASDITERCLLEAYRNSTHLRYTFRLRQGRASEIKRFLKNNATGYLLVVEGTPVQPLFQQPDSRITKRPVINPVGGSLISSVDAWILQRTFAAVTLKDYQNWLDPDYLHPVYPRIGNPITVPSSAQTVSPQRTLTLRERVNKQYLDRIKEEEQSNSHCTFTARFCLIDTENKRQGMAEIPYRLIKDGQEVSRGVSDKKGFVFVHDLLRKAPYLFQYSHQKEGRLTRQRQVRSGLMEHIDFHSFALEVSYDDPEATPVNRLPYQLILQGGKQLSGQTDAEGKAYHPLLYNPVRRVEYYYQEDQTDIKARLSRLNEKLTRLISDYAQVLAQQLAEQYPPQKSGRALRAEEVRALFDQHVEQKITELKVQAAELEEQAFFEWLWSHTTAAGRGAGKGLSEYFPDLGEFGELLESIDLDVDYEVALKAIMLGDVEELEVAFRQWQERAGSGYEEAGETMEIMILLLQDEHIRRTLISLPQRFVEAAPSDSYAELMATQGTQFVMDQAVVYGAAMLGTLVSGPGGVFAGGGATIATTGRKGAKVTEAIADVLTQAAKEIKALRNKRTERVQGNHHSSRTPAKGEKDSTPKHCKWKNCHTKHNEPPRYPGNGRVTKSSNYAEKWVEAGQEPWDLYGEGKNIAHLPDEAWDWAYQFRESPKVPPQEKLATSKQNARNGVEQYPTEKHHVIPAHLFKDLKALSHNIRLIDWDINAKENAICLPYVAADILRHNLQVHRGQHSKEYNDNLRSELKKIQAQSLNYCKNNKQKQLIKKLNKLAGKMSEHIRNWHPDYLLRKDALELKQHVEFLDKQHKNKE